LSRAWPSARRREAAPAPARYVAPEDGRSRAEPARWRIENSGRLLNDMAAIAPRSRGHRRAPPPEVRVALSPLLQRRIERAFPSSPPSRCRAHAQTYPGAHNVCNPRPAGRTTLPACARFNGAVQTAGVRDVRSTTFGTPNGCHPRRQLRALTEWGAHGDFAMTLAYTDYAPDPA
jgi:hypothetical protein